MPLPARKFLIIEDNLDNRYLLTRTLARKFPNAEIRECGDIATARAVATGESVDVVILHRADLSDGIELIRDVRQLNPAVPITMVSRVDRTREALAAGATRFLPYDEWLRIGLVTEEVLATEPYAARISALTFAIERRHVVKLSMVNDPASGRLREIEPHLIGRDASGRFAVRACALIRGTRNPIRSGWETFYLDSIKAVELTERLFAPHPEPGKDDPAIVQVLREIEGSASAFIPHRAAKRAAT
jgi:CheY-like chemotaxis protein